MAFILLPAFASADSGDVPKYVHELQGQLGQCKPSCYQKESPKPLDASTIKKVCGWIDYGFQSEQLRNGSWTPLKFLGESTAQPEVLEPCKIPGDSGGKWAPFVKQAKTSFEPTDPKTRFVVQGDWNYGRDDNNVPTRRLDFRVYATNYNLRPNECGGFDNVVCEASGSKTALAINYIHARLDEGKQLAAKGNNKMCMVATFTAVATARGIKKFRDAKIKSKAWGTGLTYQTRQDGSIDEKALFSKIDQMEHEAEALHHTCGGASPLVTEVPHKSGHSAPEFYVVPYPED